MIEYRKEIRTIAEIPMKCSECGHECSEAVCVTLESKDLVPGVITAGCPKCGAKSFQTEDCKYKFARHG